MHRRVLFASPSVGTAQLQKPKAALHSIAHSWEYPLSPTERAKATLENPPVLQNVPLVRPVSLKAVFAPKCPYLKTQGRITHLKFKLIG